MWCELGDFGKEGRDGLRALQVSRAELLAADIFQDILGKLWVIKSISKRKEELSHGL